MNQSEVIAKLQTVFDDIFLEPVVLTPEFSAADSEEWDSLLQISIVVAVEALATLGEISDRLRTVFGLYRETF